jgi:hypothetical protein
VASFRHWANGNLQVLVEPDGEGQRIRFRTVHGQSRALIFAGLGLMGVSIATTVAAMATPTTGFGDAFSQVWNLAIIGAAMLGFGALRLPGWARLRRGQMEDLSRRLTQLPPDPDRA